MHNQFLARAAIVQASNVVSATVFPQANVFPYIYLMGMASVVGSATIRFQTSIDPGGTTLVTSTWVCNSGPNFLFCFNRGNWPSIDCTVSTSGQPAASVLIVGEPLR